MSVVIVVYASRYAVARDCLLAIHEVRSVPQRRGTDRHYTQRGLEVHWDAARDILSGVESDAPGCGWTLRLHAPESCT